MQEIDCDRQHVLELAAVILVYVNVGMNRTRLAIFLSMDGGQVNGAQCHCEKY
jgi:hypothetical protein